MAADLHSSYGNWPEAIGIDLERSAWPTFAETWFGDTTTYPTGRGLLPARRGWTCACGRGFSPDVRECPYCPEAKGAQPAVRELGDWEDEA